MQHARTRGPLAPFALLALFVLLAAGCGDDGSGGTPDVDAAADAGADGDAASAEDALGDGASLDAGDDVEADVGPPVALEFAEGCNPLGAPHHCQFPFPSDVFLRDTEDGPRVRFDGEALVLDLDDRPIDWFDEYPADGFGRLPVIGAYFGRAVDVTAAVSAYAPDPERSLAPDHMSVVLRADTGEPVMHWLEVDARPPSADDATLIVRVADRLEDGVRYVVALQGLVGTDGTPIDPTPAFAAMRGGRRFEDPDVQALADRYEADVFAPLANAGVPRETLTLAWDFTVQSWDSATADMLAMRDATLASFEEQPVAATAEVVEQNDTRVRIEGTIDVPLFLEDDQTGARFVRGDDGLPRQNGTATVPFVAVVDTELWESGDAMRQIQFGHGFFVSRQEVDSETYWRLSAATGRMVIAIDHWGFAVEDSGQIAEDILRDPDGLFTLVDRMHQAFMNQLALAEAMATTLGQTNAFATDAGTRLIGDDILFYGASGGHIVGGTYVALAHRIERAVFSVGGMSLTFLMGRASPFGPLLTLVNATFDGFVNQQYFMALSSGPLDRVDGVTWAPRLLEQRIDGVASARTVLMQAGIGDSVVPNLSGILHARALGLPLVTPSARELGLLESASAPFAGSAYFEIDYGVEDYWDANARQPNGEEGNDVHQAPRNDPRGVAQIVEWLASGTVTHPCGDAPCGPDNVPPAP